MINPPNRQSTNQSTIHPSIQHKRKGNRPPSYTNCHPLLGQSKDTTHGKHTRPTCPPNHILFQSSLRPIKIPHATHSTQPQLATNHTTSQNLIYTVCTGSPINTQHTNHTANMTPPSHQSPNISAFASQANQNTTQHTHNPPSHQSHHISRYIRIKAFA